MNKILNSIKQLFCKHKETRWVKENSLFHRLNGETHYLVCEKCGKILGEREIYYE